MSNEEDKKNEVEDYSKFFEKKEKEKKKVEVPEKRKRFSFGSLVGFLKDFWSEADKKTKIELIVFLVAIIATIVILIFYSFQVKTKIPQYSQSAEEQFIPGEKEFK